MQDRKDLKIQALLERITNLTSSYENQVADLRVELTVVTQELEELTKKLTNEKTTEDSSNQADRSD